MSTESGVRGLATVALLKTQYDQGHDHIEMFMPFVLDVLPGLDSVFSTESARSAIHGEHGLKIPLETMATLLNRAKRRGILTREGGAYHKEKVPSTDTIRGQKTKIRQDHHRLAARFVEFASDLAQTLSDEDEALALVFAFLAQNEVELLLEQEVALEDLVPAGPPGRPAKLVASFLQDEVMGDPELEPVLRRMLEGLVLQNALLLKDIQAVARQFRDLSVFFDSGFLFGLLGMLGAAQETVCREAVGIVSAAGARLGVFEDTIHEMRGILSLYERKLATQQGRESLFPTPLTRHLLTSRTTPSEIRQTSALLEHTFRQAGVHPTPRPARVGAHTLDEEDLSNRLRRDDETINEPRVVHDVDCIAAVLTLRRGQVVSSIDEGMAIFATDSGRVIHTVNRWYRDQGMSGVPPIIFHTTLSNLAWLKRPASGADLKLHELAALCSAALQPDRKTWDQFMKHLKGLEESGVITTDEAVAVVVSSFTDKLLSELESDVPDTADIDAESLTEVVERVKSTYRAEQDLVIARKSDEAIAEREARLAVLAGIESGSRRIASRIAWTIAGGGALSIIVGSVLLLPGVMEIVPPPVRLYAYAFSVLAAGVTVIALFTGGSVFGLRGRLEDALHEWINQWFSPD